MEFRDLRKQYTVLKSDIDKNIQEVLEASRFVSGPQINKLEEELAEWVGVKHCITCANGTDALTIALMTWNIGEGDAVFVPDFTFFSSGESPAFLGATPIFVDVNQETYNIDFSRLEEAIINVILEGKVQPKAVIAVDLFGLPADYREIREICQKYNLLLLEDGAQGFGGSIGEKRACSFGDISTTSFFPAKPLGCYGDGGAIFTDNDEWAEIIRSICVHGKDVSNINDPNSKYHNIRLGLNSRLDTIQAAILLAKFDAFKDYELENVNKVAQWYGELLGDLDLIIPVIPENFHSSWAQYTVLLNESADREKIRNCLKVEGIPSMIYYPKPMHDQVAFRNIEGIRSNIIITDKLCKKVLSLPMGPYITREDVSRVARCLTEVI